MKQISILTVGLAAAGLAAALAVTPAPAEDLTAGKTAAQLFRTDCATCHHSPNGLVRQRGDVGELTAFLMEHYTTKSGTAAALAAYVQGFASNRGTGRDRPRNRTEGDAPATNGDTPTDARPSNTRSTDELPAPRRQTGGTAGVSRRRAHDDGDAPKTPRNGSPGRPTTTTPPTPTDPPAHTDETQGGDDTHDGDDPIARLRSYLSSGLDAENAGKEAGKEPGGDADRTTETPRVRKGHPAADAPQSQPGDQEADRPDGAAAEPPPSGNAETAPQ